MFALLLAEAVFRIGGIGPPAPRVARLPEPPPEERVNSLGFRGPEWSTGKRAALLRLLFVGDSFTYGRGVPEESIFPAVATAAISRAGRPAEFYNMSKPGWDTVSEVRSMEEIGLGYHPDLVVLVFFLNDATHLDSNPVIAWRMNRELNDRNGILNRLSRLYDTWDYTMRKRRIARETIEDYRSSYLGDPMRRDLWDGCVRALEEGRDACRRAGVPLVVVIFPMLVQLGPDYPFRDVHAEVASTCGRLGLPVLDLLPSFEGRDGPSLWLEPDNAHPNVEGHAIAGEAIALFLIESGFTDAD